MDKWILVNKKSGHERTYNVDTFWKLKRYCMSRIKLNTCDNWQIEYYMDGELDVIEKITDYFS